MTTLLDLLAQTGHATWDPLWVPILAWTVLVLPLWGLLTRVDRVHPYAEYRLLQVLLAALPVGVVATTIFDGWMASSAGLPEAGLGITVPPVEATVQSGSIPAFGWSHVLGLVTIAAILGGLVGLGRLVLNGIAAAHIRSRAVNTSLPEPARAVVNRLAVALGIDRPVRVCVHSDVVVPATIGGPRPLVLLPPSLSDRPNALRMTLAHEFVHIRRYDDCAHLAERLVAALFTVHPFVHELTTRVAEARERACDAAVLADDETSAGAYARLLTAFADGPSPRRLGALSLSESPSSLKTRLHAMRSSVSHWLSSPFSLIASLLTVGLVVTLGIVACSDSVAPNAQEEAVSPEPAAESNTSDEVYVEVQKRPDCGGIQALKEEIQYPESARNAGIEGRVFIEFIVNEEGTVTDPQVTKGVHEALDEAALAAVKGLNCEPGRVRGEAVKTKMALPVTFALPDDSPS